MSWDNSIWDEMDNLQNRMSRFLGNFSNRRFSDKKFGDDASYRKARADFLENNKEFILQVELPGVNKEDIKLDITDNDIQIKAEKKKVEKKEDKGNYSIAKSYSGFYKIISLPENANVENVDASYQNGILTIKLPKNIISQNKKEIKIN